MPLRWPRLSQPDSYSHLTSWEAIAPRFGRHRSGLAGSASPAGAPASQAAEVAAQRRHDAPEPPHRAGPGLLGVLAYEVAQLQQAHRYRRQDPQEAHHDAPSSAGSARPPQAERVPTASGGPAAIPPRWRLAPAGSRRRAPERRHRAGGRSAGSGRGHLRSRCVLPRARRTICSADRRRPRPSARTECSSGRGLPVPGEACTWSPADATSSLPVPEHACRPLSTTGMLPDGSPGARQVLLRHDSRHRASNLPPPPFRRPP
jgi:hypothetical protein